MCSHFWHVESAGPGGLAAPLLDGLSRKEEADASALGFLYPRLRADGGLPCSAEGAVPSLLSDLEEQPPVSLGPGRGAARAGGRRDAGPGARHVAARNICRLHHGSCSLSVAFGYHAVVQIQSLPYFLDSSEDKRLKFVYEVTQYLYIGNSI